MSFGKPNSNNIVVNLDGPEGNAYHLLGLAQRYAKQLKWNFEPILAEMKSGDYKNLVCTFDRHFGMFVHLETSDEDLLEALGKQAADL